MRALDLELVAFGLEPTDWLTIDHDHVELVCAVDRFASPVDESVAPLLILGVGEVRPETLMLRRLNHDGNESGRVVIRRRAQ